MYNHNLKKFWPMFVAHGSRNIKSLLPSVAGALRRRSCAPLFRSYSQLAYSPEMVFADRISTMPDVYRVPESTPLPFSNEDSLRIFELMLKVNVIDSILNDVQRQGRISFYMTNFGEGINLRSILLFCNLLV